MTPTARQNYDDVAFNVLIREFHFSSTEESDELIKKRLRRTKLGAFDRARIESLRKLKNDLYAEVSKQEKSRYYIGPTGKLRLKTEVAMSDFDLPRLTKDMLGKHPRVRRRSVKSFVPFAVFCYHML